MRQVINFAHWVISQGRKMRGLGSTLRWIKAPSLPLALVFVASCATQDVTPSRQSVVQTSASSAVAATQPDDGNAPAETAPDESIDGRGVIFPGTDVGVQMPPAREPIKQAGYISATSDIQQKSLLRNAAGPYIGSVVSVANRGER